MGAALVELAVQRGAYVAAVDYCPRRGWIVLHAVRLSGELAGASGWRPL